MGYESSEMENVPTISAYYGQLVSALENWDSVVSQFPEDAQEQLDTLVLRLEGTEGVDTGLIRQISRLFRSNAVDQKGTQIGVWLDVISDFADFFGKAVNAIVDASLDDEDVEDTEPEVEEPEEAPEEKPEKEPEDDEVADEKPE